MEVLDLQFWGMSVDIIVYLFAAGILCGAINAVVGGATLVGFPVLISVGLPPSVANASNFLATMPGYAAAIPFYMQELRNMGRRALLIILVSVIGGGLGSVILILSPSEIFVTLTPYLLLTATLLYAFGGRIHGFFARRQDAEDMKDSLLGKVSIFSFSIYGGYFGAGLGIIILSILKIIGYHDYHESNALKNLMITAVSLLSIGIFIAGGLVSWPESIVMMTGSALGGMGAANYARRIPQGVLKSAIVALGLGFSAYYFLK